jgi:glutathione synthase/RimK-type ligase-like ATP-grasp enzyme
MIITRFSQLINAYHGLGPDDVFVGKVPASHLKSMMLADLTDRGVHLLPSATAQLLNASKVAQAFVLAPWMVPHTFPITRRKELLDALARFHQAGIDIVVTKMDRMHCGHGVGRWDNLETLYNCLAFDPTAFPFVLQPYVASFVDVRVIMVGDFCEAYSRCNPHNFRMNLACGGQSRPHPLTSEQRDICRLVMERSRMPYGHIDLMVMEDGAVSLSEIRLNGGIHGARVDSATLAQLKKAHLMSLALQVCGPCEIKSSKRMEIEQV